LAGKETTMPVDPNAAIEITAYEWVPPLAVGFVKDMRVRWALEEIGVHYREHLVGDAGGEKSPDHLANQPFGQVPVYKEGGLTLFESGAILIHIGEKDERLLPRDDKGRSHAIGWAVAALNSIEPFAQTLFLMGFVGDGKDWQAAAKDAVRPFAQMRLAQLSNVLADREWLEDGFTIGDLLMVDVLRAAPEDALVAAHPNLSAYVERGTARPAFKAAMAAQLAAFARHAPVVAA
jgi:glutathione S-transferase